jgi:RNA polymerase sigma-70 factor (ECF subfamily)
VTRSTLRDDQAGAAGTTPAAPGDDAYAADRALAQACLDGDPAALASLDRLLAQAATAALRTIDPSPAFADDVLQQVRVKLLVGAGGDDHDPRPRLATYAGRGPLGGFLRVTALRTAMSSKRDGGREVPIDDALARLADDAAGPASAHLRGDSDQHLQAALRAAIAAQPSRTRALLRLYYGDGAGIEDIGRLYRVHASTVSRWLERARADILAATRDQLARALRLDPGSIDSLLAAAPALDISLGSLLRTTT